MGQKCSLVCAVIYPCGCQGKSPPPCQAYRLQSSVISTDVSFGPRLHDPFQPSTICGLPWEPRTCQLCPFCPPGPCLERRARAPLIWGPAAAVLSLHPYLGLSSFLSPPHLCPKSGLLYQSVEALALSSNPLLPLILTSPGLSVFP